MVDDANRRLYTFGGRSNKTLDNRVRRYDVDMDLWTELEVAGDAPMTVTSPAGFFHAGSIYVFGGSGANYGRESRNDLHVFDTTTHEWSRPVQRGDVPCARYGHSFDKVPGSAECLLFGGTMGWTYLDDLYSLDLATFEWTRVEPDATDRPAAGPYDALANAPPKPRYSHRTVVWNERLFVLGGGEAQMECSAWDTVHTFDLIDRRWRTHPCRPDSDGYPWSRRSHACSSFGGRAYVRGGENHSGCVDDFWSLCLSTMRWRKIVLRKPELETLCTFVSAAVTDDGRFFTQATSTGVSADDMWCVWLRVPPLQQLAFEAIKRWMQPPGRRGCAPLRMRLRELGVPRELVYRFLPSSTTSREKSP